MQIRELDEATISKAAQTIITKFPQALAYRDLFRFALAVCQRALMADIPLTAPSLEIGINDGSSATIAHFGKPKFTYGGDMPEESTCESMGLHIEPDCDVYENLIGMDAHEIPFADNSFNTIITNDMLPYGLDRSKIVGEMVRVLAPGGTLFLTESTSKGNNYPSMMARLKNDVPSLHCLDDPCGFYRSELEKLGMTNIRSRTYFDHRLAAIVLGEFYEGEVASKVSEAMRGVHEDRLRAVADLLAEDLCAPADRGTGWQIFAHCTKPGVLDRSLGVPAPICLACRSELKITLDECSCPKCGAVYQNRLDVPLVLSDFGKSYSPKSGEVFKLDGTLAREMVEKIMSDLGRPPSASVYGFDRTTKYLIKTLRHRGVSVERIYVNQPAFVGHIVSGVPVISSADVHGEHLPIVVSLGLQSSDQDRLRALGYRHKSYSAHPQTGLRRLRELVGLA